MQKKKNEKPLTCPICLQRFDYKTHLPLLFMSGSSYCSDCVQNKLHLGFEIGSLDQQQDINNQGWRNLDLLQYVQTQVENIIDSDIIEEYRNLQIQRSLVLNQLEETKVIIQWELEKSKDQIHELKTQIKKIKKNQRRKESQQVIQQKQRRNRLQTKIKQEKKKSHNIDQQIKQLQAELKQLTSNQRKKNKVSLTKLQILYKDLKKQGFKFNFQNVKFPVAFIAPKEAQLKLQPQENQQPNVTKFFL